MKRTAHLQYRKKPVVVQALQWDGANVDEVLDFISTKGLVRRSTIDNSRIYIDTLEGEMTASKDDWIIQGVKGEFYPCKPDIFEATYEKVEQ